MSNPKDSVCATCGEVPNFCECAEGEADLHPNDDLYMDEDDDFRPMPIYDEDEPEDDDIFGDGCDSEDEPCYDDEEDYDSED